VNQERVQLEVIEFSVRLEGGDKHPVKGKKKDE
jgi:hypothetical protein